MRGYDFKELEKMLPKYKWYLKESKLIELSIRVPMRELDENIGGGSSNIKSNEGNLRTLIKLEENTKLEEYNLIGKAIEKTYASLPVNEQEAMMAFYVNRKGIYRGHAKRTAAKLAIDTSTLYRWRVNISKELHFNLKEYYSFLEDA